MSVWLAITELTTRVTADLTAIVNRLKYVEHSTVHLSPDVSVEYSDHDVDSDRYLTTTYKRSDGTLLRVETYSEDPLETPQTPPVYGLKTVTLYDRLGLNPLKVYRYDVDYDASGRILSVRERV